MIEFKPCGASEPNVPAWGVHLKVGDPDDSLLGLVCWSDDQYMFMPCAESAFISSDLAEIAMFVARQTTLKIRGKA